MSPEHPSLTLGSPSCHARSVIVCEDSDQLINLIATQGEARTLRMRKSSTSCFAEGVDVRDEADEGTNAIDVDSLPKLPELSSPAAPQTVPRQQQQQFVQVTFSPPPICIQPSSDSKPPTFVPDFPPNLVSLAWNDLVMEGRY